MLLRENNLFNLFDVQLAIIESDGKLTVMPVPAKEPATAGDLNVQKPAAKMPVDLIIDGHILKHNLEKFGVSETWLEGQLSMRKAAVEEVFYAGLDTSGNLYISERGQQQ